MKIRFICHFLAGSSVSSTWLKPRLSHLKN